MSVMIHLDSAYVGFIFLVVTELVILRVVIKAQLASMDKAVKRVLDEEGAIDVDLHEYGPLKVNTSMGRSKIMALVLPAAFILALIALGEIGISGRSVPTYSTSDTITAGGYFFADAIQYRTIYQRAPAAFMGKWPTCVEYAENSVEASQVTISYEMKDTWIEFGVVSCSEEVGVVVKTGKDLDSTSTCDDFEYSITPTEDPGSNGVLVYNDSLVFDMNGGQHYDVTVEVGEVTISSCLDADGGTGKILWVSSFDEHQLNTIRYGIVDDSFRLGTDTSRERWVIDSFADSFSGTYASIAWDSAIVVECLSGCLEAIFQWILLDGYNGGTDVESLGNFFSIWYEGLNYVDESSDPVCDERADLSNWIDDGIFKVGSCEGAVAENVVLDGGQENVTLVSVWAICIVSIGCVLTLMYWFTHRDAGYNLLSFEGLSKAYYEEVNPGNTWCSGGALKMKLVNCRLSAAENKQEF
ncbi:unnamed protein product [Pylaiella littoralis]